MFNAGFHTAHHERPGAHWSTLPALHASIEGHIDARLNQRSLLWFTFKTYALGPLFPAFRTAQVGRPAWEDEAESVAPLPVLAVDAGDNAPRLHGVTA
jgi:hypothetical protein